MTDSRTTIITHHPLQREIEAAETIDQLRLLGVKMLAMVKSALDTNTDIKSIVQLISQLNDAITLRLIAQLKSTEAIQLPEGAAYLVLGSEGRGEQTLRTDQDSAIVYCDNLSAEKLRETERFANRLVAALEELGVPRCPGNIMASNPMFRLSLTEWERLIDEWITIPTPENMLKFGIFQDLRPLYGNESLGTRLRDHIRTTASGSCLFFPNMATHAVRFPAPLSIFGRIRVAHRGENKGKVDVKKAGIFAITVGVSLLALEAGISGGTTWDKLECLGKRKILTAGDIKTIEEAFTFLVRLRLQLQLKELAARGKSTNYLDPKLLSESERYQFRQALKGVTSLLRIMNNRYQLDLISH